MFFRELREMNLTMTNVTLFGNKCKDSVVTIGSSIIKESDREKLFGVTFDKKLSFTKHVEDLPKKASQKFRALIALIIRTLSN